MAFWAMLKASAKMTLRNRQMLFWAFLFPVLLMALLGVAFAGGGSPMSIRLGVVSPSPAQSSVQDARAAARKLLRRSPDTLAERVVRSLRRTEALSVKPLKSRAVAEAALEKGELDALLVIPEGWAVTGAQITGAPVTDARPKAGGGGRTDAGDGDGASADVGAKSGADRGVSAFEPATVIVSGASLGKGDAAASMVRQVVGELERDITQARVILPVGTRSVEGAAQQSYLYFLLPGVIAMSVMTAGIVGLSSAIVSWRNEGILRRIRLTPLPLWQFLGARVTTQLVLSVGQAAVLLIIGHYAFGVDLTGDPLLWLPLIILGSLAFITVGFTLSAFANSVETMGAVSNVVTLPMMFLGGVFFPMDSAPGWLKPVIALIPLKYLADGLREVMVQGRGLDSVGLELGVLAAITVGFFALSIRLFRWD